MKGYRIHTHVDHSFVRKALFFTLHIVLLLLLHLLLLPCPLRALEHKWLKVLDKDVEGQAIVVMVVGAGRGPLVAATIRYIRKDYIMLHSALLFFSFLAGENRE